MGARGSKNDCIDLCGIAGAGATPEPPMSPPLPPPSPELLERGRGCLLGLMFGDALGAAFEVRVSTDNTNLHADRATRQQSGNTRQIRRRRHPPHTQGWPPGEIARFHMSFQGSGLVTSYVKAIHMGSVVSKGYVLVGVYVCVRAR